MKNNVIISVIGPTASGKSGLAMDLCSLLDRDIVSTDSMQIYKGMDIGTAKPSEQDLLRVRHHMIDIVTPDVNYSVADYASDAKSCIENLFKENRGIVLCGGTGLYENSILGNINYSEENTDPDYRLQLEKTAETEGPEVLHGMLEKIDPDAAKSIHCNNVKRVIRALEIYKVTGMTKTEHDRQNNVGSSYEYVRIGIDYSDRQNLVDRINRRVDLMFENGLADEVSSLLAKGYLTPDSTAGQAIGYKETIDYLKGNATLEDTKEAIKISTRQYAKRQLTWFRRYKDVNWIFADLDHERSLIDKAKNCLGI